MIIMLLLLLLLMLHCSESILAEVAPHYIPETEPSIHHLAPKVPVPIFTTDRRL